MSSEARSRIDADVEAGKVYRYWTGYGLSHQSGNITVEDRESYPVYAGPWQPTPAKEQRRSRGPARIRTSLRAFPLLPPVPGIPTIDPII